MSATILNREPPEVRAGLTWQWRREDLVAYFPATLWTLTYWFKKVGATGANFSVVATADGSLFAITVASTVTAKYGAGDYNWSALVNDASSPPIVKEVDNGTMRLLARYDAAANVDDRTHERKVLDALETAIENKALLTPDQQEYTIGNRHLKRMSYTELIAARDNYKGKVAAQEMAQRLRDGRGGNRVVWKL